MSRLFFDNFEQNDPVSGSGLVVPTKYEFSNNAELTTEQFIRTGTQSLKLPANGFAQKQIFNNSKVQNICGLVEFTIELEFYIGDFLDGLMIFQVDGKADAGTPDTKTVLSISPTNPAVITTTQPHGLTTGDIRTIFGSGVPAIDYIAQYVTVTGPSTYTIPVDGTGWTSGGTVTDIPPDPDSNEPEWDTNEGFRLELAEIGGTNERGLSFSSGLGISLITPFGFDLELDRWHTARVQVSQSGSLPGGATAKMFIDGDEKASTTDAVTTPTISNWRHFSIGNDETGNVLFYIDNFRAYDDLVGEGSLDVDPFSFTTVADASPETLETDTQTLTGGTPGQLYWINGSGSISNDGGTTQYTDYVDWVDGSMSVTASVTSGKYKNQNLSVDVSVNNQESSFDVNRVTESPDVIGYAGLADGTGVTGVGWQTSFPGLINNASKLTLPEDGVVKAYALFADGITEGASTIQVGVYDVTSDFFTAPLLETATISVTDNESKLFFTDSVSETQVSSGNTIAFGYASPVGNDADLFRLDNTTSGDSYVLPNSQSTLENPADIDSGGGGRDYEIYGYAIVESPAQAGIEFDISPANSNSQAPSIDIALVSELAFDVVPANSSSSAESVDIILASSVEFDISPATSESIAQSMSISLGDPIEFDISPASAQSSAEGLDIQIGGPIAFDIIPANTVSLAQRLPISVGTPVRIGSFNINWA